MTADEWQTQGDARAMLEFVRSRATTRQLRYFGAACCRGVWDFLTDDRLKAAVECVERFAAGAATKQDLAECQGRARVAAQELRLRRRAGDAWHEVSQRPPSGRDWEPYHVVLRTALAVDAVPLVARPTGKPAELGRSVSEAFGFVVQAQTPGWALGDTDPRVLAAHAAVVRCVFGDPFRPYVFDASHRTEAAVAIARSMYDSRDFSVAPVLADALEDAGLTDAAVLGHLRQAGGHVRGCWVVDAVLGRA